MKALKILLLILILFATTDCGIKKAMKELGKSTESIAASIEKVSNSATALLNKINDISRLVDSKLESGEINQGIADMIDGRLQAVSQMLESTIQNAGGYMFDRLDGSVDNAFSELGKLLDDLSAGILGNYIPAIIDQVSAQMQIQITTITASLEDVIVVTAGQTVYIIDKAINGFVITLSIIFLALALIILAIILLRKGRKLTGANYIGIGLIGVFLVVFLIIIFSSTVRGKLIAGFDYGAALKVKEVTPKITSVVPENIVLGKTNRIYIYGLHLNQLQKIAVKLTQGNMEKFTFPQATLIVNTSNRIILGNLQKELKWTVPVFQTFRTYMATQGVLNQVPEAQMVEVNNRMNAAQFPNIKPGISAPAVVSGSTPHIATMQPMAHTVSTATLLLSVNKRTEFTKVAEVRKNAVVPALGLARADLYLDKIKNFFQTVYSIPEGDYGLKVFADTALIETPLFVTVSNPPPPVPNPDIFIMDMNWTGGVVPMSRESATLDITFGFSHPEQITRDFKVKITTVPFTTSVTLTVPEGKIAAATYANRVTVTTNPFSVSSPGTYRFNCSIDDQNEITESNEGNNTYSKNLVVGEYVYDVTLANFSFEPLSHMSKLNFSILVDAGGNPTRTCNGTISPVNTTVPLNCSFIYPGMHEGQTVMLTFHPTIEINMIFMNMTFDLGNVTWQKYLDMNPTGMVDSKEYDILREGTSYKFHGKMTVKKRKSQ